METVSSAIKISLSYVVVKYIFMIYLTAYYLQ